MYSAPKCWACCLDVFDQIGAVDAFRKSREVLDQRGQRELAAWLVAGHDKGFQIRARGIHGSGISGAARADNNHISHVWGGPESPIPHASTGVENAIFEIPGFRELGCTPALKQPLLQEHRCCVPLRFDDCQVQLAVLVEITDNDRLRRRIRNEIDLGLERSAANT